MRKLIGLLTILALLSTGCLIISDRYQFTPEQRGYQYMPVGGTTVINVSYFSSFGFFNPYWYYANLYNGYYYYRNYYNYRYNNYRGYKSSTRTTISKRQLTKRTSTTTQKPTKTVIKKSQISRKSGSTKSKVVTSKKVVKKK